MRARAISAILVAAAITGGCAQPGGTGTEAPATGRDVITTRMACLPESDLEARFLSALSATTSQRVAGETLGLRDRDGKLRMRLEARYLK